MGEAKKVLAKGTRTARKEGWEVSKTGSGHLRFESPDGNVTVTPTSPGRGRSINNSLANLKRAGLDLRAPDPERDRRLADARKARQQLDHERMVISCLEGAVGWMTVADLAQCTELGDSELAAALRRVGHKHAELDVDGTRYAWDPPVNDFELWAHKRQQRGLSDLSILSEREIATLAARAVVPPGYPNLLETLTADQHSRLLLRDENGKYWLALPVAADQP